MKIGEVVEVQSLTRFTTQLTNKEGESRFADFAKVNLAEIIIVGTISNIWIPNPRLGAFPRPKYMKPEILEGIFPDLKEQFPRYCAIEVVGYVENEMPIHEVPPLPPSIYSHVESMADPEIKGFHMSKTGTAVVDYIIRLRDDSSVENRSSLVREIVRAVADCFEIDPDQILEVLG